jgi:Glycosyltransferase family 87
MQNGTPAADPQQHLSPGLLQATHSRMPLAGVAALNVLLLVGFFAPAPNTPVYDLPQFYFASQLMRSGKAAELYNPSAYKPLIEDLRAIDPRAADHSLYFNRPAFEAPLFFPLSFFSFQTASRVVFAVNVVLLAAVVWLLPRWFPSGDLTRAWLIAYIPFAYTIALGQDTLLLTLLIAASLRLALDKADVPAGVLLGLAIFKPQVVFLVPLALAASRRWRILASFSATSLALLAVSLGMVGWRGFVQWFRLLQAPTTDAVPWMMGNLRALSFHVSPAVVSLTAVAVCSAFAATMWRSPFLPKFCAALLAGLLLSPHTYIQDYSVAAIVALAALPPPLCYALLLPWTYFHPAFGTRNIILFVFLAAVCLLGIACTPILSKIGDAIRPDRFRLKHASQPRREPVSY